MAAAFGPSVVHTEMELKDLITEWDVGDVFKIVWNMDEFYPTMIMGNVTKEPLGLIAEYAGLPLRHGNLIAGTESIIRLRMMYVEAKLFCLWTAECKERIWSKDPVQNLPSPLSDDAIMCANQTLYVWIGFLRGPGQDWRHVKYGKSQWSAIRVPRRSLAPPADDDDDNL